MCEHAVSSGYPAAVHTGVTPMRSTLLSAIDMVVIVVALALVARCVPAASWGPDQAVTYRQALHALQTRSYPLFGLINSQGFRNPNALVLLTIPLVALFRDNVAGISLALCGLQLITLVGAYRRLMSAYCASAGPLAYAAGLVFVVCQPGFHFRSMELWAQSLAQAGIVLLTTLLLTGAKRRWNASDWWLGFLILFLPALHLALAPVVPIAIVWLLLRRSRHHVLSVSGGALLACLLSWVPWAAYAVSHTATLYNAEIVEAHAIRESPLYGLIPFVEFWRILTGPYDIPQCQVGLAGSAALRLVSILAAWRAVASLGVLMMTARQLYRKRPRPFDRPLWGFAASLMAVLSVYGFMGWAPFRGRVDLGVMFVAASQLVAATTGAALLSAISGTAVRRAVAVASIVAEFCLWAPAQLCVARDTTHAGRFTVLDIPVGERVAVLHRIRALAHSQAEVSASYVLAADVPFYVQRYGALDEQGFYRWETLLEGLSLVRKPRLVFVAPSAAPDFVIRHPASHTARGRLDVCGAWYQAVADGSYLTLWQRVASDSADAHGGPSKRNE